MPRISKRSKPTHPAIPGKSADERRQEAMQRLGITQDELDAAPVITHVIKAIPGKSVDKAVEFLRGSEDENARKWLRVYDSVPMSYRSLLPFEAYCVAAGIPTRKMLGVITEACFDQTSIAAKLMAKSAHPKLVEVSVEQAMQPANFKERVMLHQGQGFAPVSKTQVINVGGDINQDNRVQSVSVGMLGNVADRVGQIADRFNERMEMGDGGLIEGEVMEGEVVEGEEVTPYAGSEDAAPVKEVAGVHRAVMTDAITSENEDETDDDGDW